MNSQLVLCLADVRVLAFGTLNRPRSSLVINPNAHIFLHPAMDDNSVNRRISLLDPLVTDHGVYPMPAGPAENHHDRKSFLILMIPGTVVLILCLSKEAAVHHAQEYDVYELLTHPLPAHSHRNYPWYTPGGGDKRWIASGDEEEEGLCWVGSLMSPQTFPLQDARLTDMN